MDPNKRQRIEDYGNAEGFHQLPDDIQENILGRVMPFDYMTPGAVDELPPDSIEQILSLADNQMYSTDFLDYQYAPDNKTPADKLITAKVLTNRLNAMYPTEERHNQMVARNMAHSENLHTMTDRMDILEQSRVQFIRQYERGNPTERANKYNELKGHYIRNKGLAQDAEMPPVRELINSKYAHDAYRLQDRLVNFKMGEPYNPNAPRTMNVPDLPLDRRYRNKEINALRSLYKKPMTYIEARDAHRFNAHAI